MRNITMQQVSTTRVGAWKPAVPSWWVVFSSELTDLWIGGKALYLILAYSVLAGIQTFVMATNFELSLFTPAQMLLETIKSCIQVSLLIGLIIGSDSISGERERSTLEGLLLTPASRSQLILGKFIASLSAWPVALMIAIPAMYLLSQGEPILGSAVLWGALVGLLLVPAFTALGMIISYACNSNKTSFFISLGVFLVSILMGQVIGTTKIGVFGQLLLWVNPIPAGFDYLSKMLVSNGTFSEFWTFLQSPLVFSVVMLGLLFFYFGPKLSVEVGKTSNFWSKISRTLGLTMIVCLALSLYSTPVMALPNVETQDDGLLMSISLASQEMKTGDSVEVETTISNGSAEASQPVIVAMNIINLNKEGDVVDPEDWSPQRTQYIDTVAPNESATLTWTVNAVLDGNFMVYFVAIPQPTETEANHQIVSSPGLHLSVDKFTSLNPSGVLPFVIGVPVVLVIAIVLLFRLRRRQIDMGGSS